MSEGNNIDTTILLGYIQISDITQIWPWLRASSRSPLADIVGQRQSYFSFFHSSGAECFKRDYVKSSERTHSTLTYGKRCGHYLPKLVKILITIALTFVLTWGKTLSFFPGCYFCYLLQLFQITCWITLLLFDCFLLNIIHYLPIRKKKKNLCFYPSTSIHTSYFHPPKIALIW